MKQLIKKIFERLKQINSLKGLIFVFICCIASLGLISYPAKLVHNLQSSMLREIFAFILAAISVLIIIFLIYFILDFFPYKNEKEENKILLKRYKEKLSEDEFTEVFFKSEIKAPQGAAGELYWDMKHCEDPHWFARWQDDKIYVVLKDNDKFVRDWQINLYFFDYFFELED